MSGRAAGEAGGAREGAGERARRLRARLFAAACALFIAFFCVQILTFDYGRDQGIYAMVARAILEGDMPYRDAWDFKPPGVFLIYAASRALFGPAMIGVRILEVAGILAQTYGLVRLGEHLFGSRLVGLFGAALAAMVHAQLDFWHTAQPESFGGMITVFALLAGLPERPFEPGRPASPRRLLLSGALFAAAGLLKPPLVGGAAVVALAHLAPAARPRELRALLRASLWLALGGTLPVLLTALWFLAEGALGDLYRTLFVFTPHYTALGWEGTSIVTMLYHAFAEWLTRYSSVLTGGLLLLLGFRPSREERSGVFVLSGVVAIHLVGVAMQGKFFPYHYGATWPLSALLAALGFAAAARALAPRTRAAIPIVAALFAALMLGRTATKDVPWSFRERCVMRLRLATGGLRDEALAGSLASVADVSASANREVARLLARRVPPDRPIFVWGFEPVIYDLAGRAPSSRYLYNVPQRVAWAKPEARAVLMADLEARPPAAIVIERRDVFPMVTGDALDSRDSMHDFPSMRARLARYELAATIEDFEIYLEPGL